MEEGERIFSLLIHSSDNHSDQGLVKQKTGIRIFTWSACRLPLLCPGHQQGAGSKVEKLAPRPAPIWNAGTGGTKGADPLCYNNGPAGFQALWQESLISITAPQTMSPVYSWKDAYLNLLPDSSKIFEILCISMIEESSFSPRGLEKEAISDWIRT